MAARKNTTAKAKKVLSKGRHVLTREELRLGGLKAAAKLAEGRAARAAAEAEAAAKVKAVEDAKAIRNFKRMKDGPARDARWNELFELGILVSHDQLGKPGRI